MAKVTSSTTLLGRNPVLHYILRGRGRRWTLTKHYGIRNHNNKTSLCSLCHPPISILARVRYHKQKVIIISTYETSSPSTQSSTAIVRIYPFLSLSLQLTDKLEMNLNRTLIKCLSSFGSKHNNIIVIQDHRDFLNHFISKYLQVSLNFYVDFFLNCNDNWVWVGNHRQNMTGICL